MSCAAGFRPDRRGPARRVVGLLPRYVALVGWTLTAGCTVGPDFLTPKAPVAENYLEARNPSLLLDYQNTVLKAQKEVEDGLATFLQSREAAAALQRSVIAARKALDIAVLQYQVGTRDFTTVLTAERNLYDAENNFIVASGGTSNGLVQVYRALVGGWQLRESADFVTQTTREQMRQRTNWGNLLPEGSAQPPAPGLSIPEDRGPTIRPPQW